MLNSFFVSFVIIEIFTLLLRGTYEEEQVKNWDTIK
jgi:hypothetical protein